MADLNVVGPIKTLAGEETTMEYCPYGDGDKPHVFIVLAYAPGKVLQVLCQHCVLLSSFFITPESDDEPLVGMN